MNQREIIVVGSGAAGSTVAILLAQQGHDVLLLDRQNFPRDKTCGDGIPAGAMQILGSMGMESKIRAGLENNDFYPINRMTIVSPRGYSLCKDIFRGGSEITNTCVAKRHYFDFLLQQHAIDSGAEFSVALVKKPIIEKDCVVGVQVVVNGIVKELYSRIIIAADGSSSVIAKYLQPDSNWNPNKHRSVAVRAYADIETHPHCAEFFLSREIAPGYGWIFPTGENKANIGIGLNLDLLKKRNYNLKEKWNEFLAMPTIKNRLRGKPINFAGGQLNCGYRRNLPRAFNGALLTGDAAAFVEPLTGSGIYYSMVSAKLAAFVAHNALNKNDTSRHLLQTYEKLCRKRMWRKMTKLRIAHQLFNKFPQLIDFVVKTEILFRGSK